MSPTNESLSAIAETFHRLSQIAAAGFSRGGGDALAHLRVLSQGRTRDVLFGERTVLSSGAEVPILDWRTAPLAEVLFSCVPGDDYQIEVEDGRSVEGALLERHLLHCDRGRLLAVATNAWQARLTSNGLELCPTVEVELCQGAHPNGLRLGAVELDETQVQAIAAPRDRPLLILGRAGTGKTTVAVARLARILKKKPTGKRRPTAAVIVPSEGLRRLYDRLLEAAGLRHVQTHVFDRFAHREARRLLADVPRTLSADTPFEVIALKRHPAVAQALVARVEAERRGERGQVDREYLAEIEPRGARQLSSEEQGEAPRTSWFDLLEIFGDSHYLAQILAAAGPSLGPRHAAAVKAHTNRQFSPSSDSTFAHVLAEQRETLDGRGLDDGTPEEDAGTLDAEDPPLLLALHHLRTGSPKTAAGALRRYDCLVVDEGQELAPLELALVGRAVAPGGCLTVAGDARQQVDPTAYFTSFEQTLRDIGASNPLVQELSTTYRCPPAVMEFACRLADEPMTQNAAPMGRDSLRLSSYDTTLLLAVGLTEALEAFCMRHPQASAILVCRTPQTAETLAHELRHVLSPQLVRDGEFSFEAGVCVTDVSQVKGLEFDLVVVPDADAVSYPDTQEARRALYVAVTRAVHGLWLCWSGAPSPLLEVGRPGEVPLPLGA